MTTRNIAPREQNEGSIGTQAKPWGDGYFKQMHITDDLTVSDTVSTANLNVTGTATAVTPASTDNSTKVATTAFVKAFQRADGWNAETLYEAGNTVRTATLPSQYLLRCTASGTSGTTEPDCTGLSLGDTINEGATGGTTVWVVDSYLTTSGGVLRGAITRNGGGDALVNSNDTSWTRMNGGSGSNSGASISLYGKSSTAPGRFELRAFDGNAANDKKLIGNINGTLTWVGKNVAREDTAVMLTGNQTVAGTKTFGASPIAPTPAANDNSTKVATTAFVNTKAVNYLPLSGGTMTGAIKNTTTNFACRNVDNSSLYLCGGSGFTAATAGANLVLSGKSASSAGWFVLDANTGTDVSHLIGKPNGSLLWGKGSDIKEVERVQAYSGGNVGSETSGYIRYVCGLQICWGRVSLSLNSAKSVTFPAAFSGDPAMAGCLIRTNTWRIYGISSTGFSAQCSDSSNNNSIYWIAVGKWK